MRELTAREKKFVREWSVDRNQTQAAIRAGYSKKVAAVTACKLMKKPHIKAAIQRVEKRDVKQLELTRERVIQKVAEAVYRDYADLEGEDGIVFSRMRDIPKQCHPYIDGFEVKQVFTEEGTLAAQYIKIKVSPNSVDRDQALKVLGAYAAEKQEVKHSVDLDELLGYRTEEVNPVTKRLEEEESEGGAG